MFQLEFIIALLLYFKNKYIFFNHCTYFTLKIFKQKIYIVLYDLNSLLLMMKINSSLIIKTEIFQCTNKHLYQIDLLAAEKLIGL